MQQRREPRELDKHSPRIFFVSSRLIQPFAVRPSRQARFQQITHQPLGTERALSTFRRDGDGRRTYDTTPSASALGPQRRRAAPWPPRSPAPRAEKRSEIIHTKTPTKKKQRRDTQESNGVFSNTPHGQSRAPCLSSWSPAAVIGGCQPHAIKRWRKKSTPRARLFIYLF
jgi:hypothetical protein